MPLTFTDGLRQMYLADLAEVATGRVNPRRLAHAELAARGYNRHGSWVGFDRARADLEHRFPGASAEYLNRCEPAANPRS